MKHFYLDSILSSQSVTVFLWNCKKTNFKSGLKNQNTYWIQYPYLATANPEYDTACNSYAIIWDGVKMHFRPGLSWLFCYEASFLLVRLLSVNMQLGFALLKLNFREICVKIFLLSCNHVRWLLTRKTKQNRMPIFWPMAIVTKEIWVMVAYKRVFEKVVVVAAYTCTRSSC